MSRTQIKASKKQGHYILEYTKYTFKHNMRIHCAIEPETIDRVLHPIITYTYVIQDLTASIDDQRKCCENMPMFQFFKGVC